MARFSALTSKKRADDKPRLISNRGLRLQLFAAVTVGDRSGRGGWCSDAPHAKTMEPFMPQA